MTQVKTISKQTSRINQPAARLPLRPVYDFQTNGQFSKQVSDFAAGIGLAALLQKGVAVYE